MTRFLNATAALLIIGGVVAIFTSAGMYGASGHTWGLVGAEGVAAIVVAGILLFIANL